MHDNNMHDNNMHDNSNDLGLQGTLGSKCGCWILLGLVAILLLIVLLVPPSVGY